MKRGEKRNFIEEKPNAFSQVIKIIIDSNKSCGLCVP